MKSLTVAFEMSLHCSATHGVRITFLFRFWFQQKHPLGFLRIPIGISGRITAKDQNTSQPERYDTGYRCHEARSRESPNNYKHCIVLESEFGKELKMADLVRRLINWNRMVFYMEIFYFSCDKAEYPHA